MPRLFVICFYSSTNSIRLKHERRSHLNIIICSSTRAYIKIFVYACARKPTIKRICLDCGDDSSYDPVFYALRRGFFFFFHKTPRIVHADSLNKYRVGVVQKVCYLKSGLSMHVVHFFSSFRHL